MKPFVKWAGGKRQLIKKIEEILPNKYNSYYEPFVGGGALLFHLKPQKAFINDLSEELINLYTVVRDNFIELCLEIDKIMKKHILSPKENYYKIRDMDKNKTINTKSNIYKAARFMYLNKTCFNGLYRVNASGNFNVPFNGKSNVKVYEMDNLEQISNYLSKSVEIMNTDFEEVCKKTKKGDLVFLDPPYDLLKKDTFSEYNSLGFKEEEQKRLAKVFYEMDKKGVKIILTNHNTPLINKLYSKYKIEIVQVKRMINSNSSKRMGEEVIITNY